MTSRNLLLVTALVFAVQAPNFAQGQAPAGYTQLRDATVSPQAAPMGSYQRLTGQNNPALNYYGGGQALRYATAARPMPMPAPQPVQTAPLAKPFQNLQQTSGLSPYLALDYPESGVGALNFYSFVRPQMEQQRAQQIQQVQYQRMQQQLRVATAGAAIAPSPNGGMPTTGHSTQFQNHSGYYPTLR